MLEVLYEKLEHECRAGLVVFVLGTVLKLHPAPSGSISLSKRYLGDLTGWERQPSHAYSVACYGHH